ncbi:DNA (cytosine-5-)-methyltransferase [Cylindrospermopsis raciborskii LB2897]|uniref:DNA (cytosine-5-)-methyltransferase n=1 Tax=Cylindrospermopsis raciborskii CENA303 TaxID=1170769 RepID=A0A1X4G3N2_9CYAN|nr:DNA cytosine methyltransferase [Cylindrospermopsis raciborskii]MBG0742749.1 DNA cytosine methyltransferase [Cylindrospermopsis raciborskii KL1]NLQ07141.1 DNA (cytosine-5-)-methyltransferase [Cylindrospermopsis raciborskii LB2897]OSO88233.1 DNA (cytosine-5-)-methyltransferase [Cylindrospermopsis raciborskii CENA303]
MSNLSLSCLELFAGAGGLAKGLEMAKIKHKALIELDYNACLTLANNYNHQLIYNVDVRKFKFEEVGEVDIIAGGPPCQPFSLGGKHKGHMDQRDMFPYACKAISICKPKAFIFENVKGMLRPAFSNYFEYLILSLTYPEVSLKDLQFWEEHLIVLKTIDNSNNYPGVKYNVVFGLLNAANYGIPQRRERVFIVGIRQDLNINWSFPQPSHSYDSLLWSQFVSYDYWERHQIKPISIEWVDQRTKQKINQLIQKPTLFPPVLKPWKTIRDQIGELPQPDSQGSFDQEHILRQGARSYPGHNGSYIDMPSKTIKAGDHGVPGGENMIRYPDETVRYYTILEAKRIQTFPDNYRFIGCWTESMRQIGNAVPVELGYFLASSLSKALC